MRQPICIRIAIGSTIDLQMIGIVEYRYCRTIAKGDAFTVRLRETRDTLFNLLASRTGGVYFRSNKNQFSTARLGFGQRIHVLRCNIIRHLLTCDCTSS